MSSSSSCSCSGLPIGSRKNSRALLLRRVNTIENGDDEANSNGQTSSSDEEMSIAEAIKGTVTLADIVAVANRACEKDRLVQVETFTLRPYSSKIIGHFASHRQLCIKIKKNNNHESETLSLFIKSLPYDSKQQLDFIRKEGMFAEEYNFYHNIVPLLLKNYRSEKWAPRCYSVKLDCLIMDDLKCQGFKHANFYDSLVFITAALATLARMHGCSIAAESRFRRSPERPATLRDLYPNFFREKTFNRRAKLYRWFMSAVNVTCRLAEKFGHKSDKFPKIFEQLFELVKPSAKYRNVVCHSDLFSNNIMFSESRDSAILVDFQMIRYAPPATDILQLLYLHSSRDFRLGYEKELVKFYYSILVATVNRSDQKDRAKLPSINELYEAMNDLRLFGVGMASLYLPMVLIDPDIVKEQTKDEEEYEMFLFGDRIDFTKISLENPVYEKRIKDVLDDFAEFVKNYDVS